jgi:hypothetical protein
MSDLNVPKTQVQYSAGCPERLSLAGAIVQSIVTHFIIKTPAMLFSSTSLFVFYPLSTKPLSL